MVKACERNIQIVQRFMDVAQRVIYPFAVLNDEGSVQKPFDYC